MIQAVKNNEQARQEYRFMSGFEMDAREEGRSEGIAQGFSDGARQKALETAKAMKNMNYPISDICTISGLSVEEVEKL